MPPQPRMTVHKLLEEPLLTHFHLPKGRRSRSSGSLRLWTSRRSIWSAIPISSPAGSVSIAIARAPSSVSPASWWLTSWSPRCTVSIQSQILNLLMGLQSRI